MLPADKLWPVNSAWDYHAGGGSSRNSTLHRARDKRYGPSKSAEEYARKAQVMAYEGHRRNVRGFRARAIIYLDRRHPWRRENAWPGILGTL